MINLSNCRINQLICAGVLLVGEFLALCFSKSPEQWNPTATPLFLLLATARVATVIVWLRCSSSTDPDECNSGSMAKSWVASGNMSNVSETPPTPPNSPLLHHHPNPVLQNIIARRSVFCKDMIYPPNEIPESDLQLLLRAAMWAPSHGRTDPWHFVVFATPSARAGLRDTTIHLMTKYANNEAAQVAQREFDTPKRWSRASAFIAICMKRVYHSNNNSSSLSHSPTCASRRPKNPEWEDLAAVGAAVQNLHLATTALSSSSSSSPLKLCGYWSSWYSQIVDSLEMKEYLGLNANTGDRCLGFFVLGHSNVMHLYRGKRGELSEVSEWRH
jgi:nitroreductase